MEKIEMLGLLTESEVEETVKTNKVDIESESENVVAGKAAAGVCFLAAGATSGVAAGAAM